MKIPRQAIAFVAVLCPAIALASASCGGGNGQSSGSTLGSGGASGSGSSNGGSAPSTGPFGQGTFAGGTGGAGAGGSTPCSGLACQVHSCTGGGSTTITGTVYDPAGKNPLYGVVAYVPNKKPDAFTAGASCYTCDELYSGNPIASAVTDADGKFTIKGAPDGDNIPLVIQVGKWRRQFTIPTVSMCSATAMADKMLTLPKNGTEGDLPDIAISTGGADTLECLLSRVGVDKSEYVTGLATGGHIHIFRGADTGGNNPHNAPDTADGAPKPSDSLWDSSGSIMKYDIVLLSCEGQETASMNQKVLFDYAAAGGRVFASHFHYAWFNTGPFGSANLAQWKTKSNDIGDISATIVTKTWSNQPFVRGQALYDWLGNVNALKNGELPITAARHNADVTMANTPSQPWILADSASQSPGAAQDFTFDTPLGAAADKQCGRVAFSDMHVGAASGDYKSASTTPEGCAEKDLSPQEKALEFILFDLSSCVTPNNMPQNPPTKPPT